MDKIFAVVDKTGREIHLSKERWLHVRLEHPKITDYEEIENAVKNHPLKWMACLVLEHAQELESNPHLLVVISYYAFQLLFSHFL